MTKRPILFLLCCIGTLGCSETPRTDEQLNGVLWVQSSAEYQVSAVQTFRAAARSVKEALQDKMVTAALEQTSEYQSLPPAVIVDVDETVLDNSPFQARLVKTGRSFSPASWEAWVLEAQAEAIPGAKEFVEFLKEQGVELFYVTNRQLKAPTLKNIRAALDPDVSADHLLCKYEKPGWGSNKTSRRALIAKTHRILVLMGDDYNDFAFLGKVSPDERVKKAQDHESYWGTQWFLLSNPLYGNWERALYNYDFGLDHSEVLKAKRQHLNTKD